MRARWHLLLGLYGTVLLAAGGTALVLVLGSALSVAWAGYLYERRNERADTAYETAKSLGIEAVERLERQDDFRARYPWLYWIAFAIGLFGLAILFDYLDIG